MPAAFARLAPSSGCSVPRVCEPSERKRIETGGPPVLRRGRDRRTRSSARAAWAAPEPPAGRASPRPRARRRSPCRRSRGTCRASSSDWSTSLWSVVGGAATSGSPANAIRPIAQPLRRVVEERARRGLGGREPRRLDVRRLHRARDVDHEDDGRLVLQHRRLHVRAGEREAERGEREQEEDRRRRTGARRGAGRSRRARRGS